MSVKTLRISLTDEEWVLVAKRSETVGAGGRPLGGEWSENDRLGLAISVLLGPGLSRMREKRDAYGLPVEIAEGAV